TYTLKDADSVSKELDQGHSFQRGPCWRGKEPMFKKTLSILAIMTAGAGMALGQDAAGTFPAARLQPPAPSSASNSYTQPVTPPAKSSPYGNSLGTMMTADAGTAIAGPTGTAPTQLPPMGGGCANGGCANGGCANGCGDSS